MNSLQLIALLVCALLSISLLEAAPAQEAIKPEDMAKYAEEAEHEELLNRLRQQYAQEYADVDEQPMQKRAQTFVRFGKRAQTFVRFGKRAQTFVRFGRSAPEENQ